MKKQIIKTGLVALLFTLLPLSQAFAVTIDWASTLYPQSLTGTVGAQTELIYGWVYESGITDSLPEQASARIKAQVGYGVANDFSSWQWFDAAFHPFLFHFPYGVETNDEYMGRITPSSPGTFSYAFRFSADGDDY